MVRSISAYMDHVIPGPRQGCPEEGRSARLTAIFSLTNVASVITVNTFSYCKGAYRQFTPHRKDWNWGYAPGFASIFRPQWGQASQSF